MFKSLFSPSDAPSDAKPPSAPARADEALDARLVERHLGQLCTTDGVLGCALVDMASGLLVAEQGRPGVELDALGAVCAEVLRQRRDAARRFGLPDLDEVTFTAGAEQQVVRTLPRRPGMFLLLLVDRPRANLALARFRMAEAQRNLA